MTLRGLAGTVCGGVFLVMVAVLLSAPPAHAADTPRFEVKATIGFGGSYKVNEWTPLRLNVANPDGFRGPVRIRVDMESGGCGAHGRVLRRYGRDIVLDGSPEASTIIAIRDSYSTSKCWTYLIDARAEGGTAPVQQLDASCPNGQCPLLRPADRPRTERVLKSLSMTNLLLQDRYSYETAYAVVNPSPAMKDIMSVSSLLKCRERDSKGRAVAADELVEDPTLYQCLDALILDSVAGAPLTTAHGAALRDWVLSGGMLILTRACMETPWGSELLGLFPARAAVTGPAAPVDWKTAIPFFLGRPAEPDPVEVLPLDLDGTFTAVRANGAPLLASRRFGLGTLVLVPFHTDDVRANGGPDRVLRERVWSRALEKAAESGSRWIQCQPLVPQSASIRRLALPYAGFVLLSAVCLGPLCMLLVRRRDRRIHVLWLLPLFSSLLCALAFGTALHFRSATAHVESVTLLVGDVNSGRGHAREETGVISGSSGMYALGPLPPGSSIREDFEGSMRESLEVGLFPPEVVQGNGLALDRMYMNRWSMRFFLVEHAVDMPRLSGSLRYEDGRIRGWVQNDSPQDIDAAFLLFKWNRQPLGPLPCGKRVALDLALTPPPEAVHVFNPYYGNYDMIAGPLNRVHWPDIPFDEGVAEIVRPEMACDPPAILAVLPPASHKGAGLIGAANWSETRRVIGLWRLALESTPRPDQLPGPAGIPRASYNNMWDYVTSVGKWNSSGEFAFPPVDGTFARPELTLHTRIDAKSAKEMKPDDELKVRFFNWAEDTWTTEMKVVPGDMLIPDGDRFVRPGDNAVVFGLQFAGPRAEKYERVDLDRVEMSLREAKP